MITKEFQTAILIASAPISETEIKLVTANAPIMNVLYRQINNTIEGDSFFDDIRRKLLKWIIFECVMNKDFHCVNIIDLANKCISFRVYMVFYEICALFQIKYNGIFYYINYKDERNGFISSNRAKIIFEEIKSNIRKTRYLVKSNSLI